VGLAVKDASPKIFWCALMMAGFSFVLEADEREALSIAKNACTRRKRRGWRYDKGK
jgi:hypothetical protein